MPGQSTSQTKSIPVGPPSLFVAPTLPGATLLGMPHSADIQDHPPLIGGLLRPEAYDHPTGEFSLIETHISWVILTGTFAYKLKKPIRYDFLDYSTLTLREFFCREELRLNRRFAPHLYLEVAPITGTPEAPEVGGTGKPFEFAVKMRQFSQDALLSHLIENGKLRPGHIDQLAAEVADFHSKADTAPPGSPFGTPEAILGPARDNFQTLLACKLPDGHESEIRRLSDWTETEFRRLVGRFKNRRETGAVRECHGDLHLRNMLLEENGTVTLFDGIEFNESFRWIDVINEIAFCTMDLEDRGRPDLAHRLLNAYLELTGDYGGLGVARFYTVYRAMVRAKVAALRLRQEKESGEVIDPELAREITAYFHIADRAMKPETPPFLAITHGVSGSGKTTGTQTLVDTLGAIRIRSDCERKRLFGLTPAERSDSKRGAGIYTGAATGKTYQRCLELAETAIKANYPAIIDATFLKRSLRLMFSELAKNLAVPFRILLFDAPIPELRRRVQNRQKHARDASEATLEVLDHQLETAEWLDPGELMSAIRADGRNTDLLSALTPSAP